MLLYPFLKAVSKAAKEETDSGALFKTGEVPLQAMKNQTNDSNEAGIYLADGVIRFYKIKQLEVLILETSSSFNKSDKVKSSFDHHKALFSVLAMLKTVADEYYLASVNTFSKLKLFFVHASGIQCNLCIISL